MSSKYTGKLLGGSHQGCAGGFSQGSVVQLSREEVIIKNKRVFALIDHVIMVVAGQSFLLVLFLILG